jgi:hypothetical protein
VANERAAPVPPGHVRLANAKVELLFSVAYGPRITRYAPVGGKNLFCELPPELQAKPTPFGDDWHLYGGHRLWYAPEDPVRTYWPDNAPVEAVTTDRRVTVTQRAEGHTGLVKTIDVTLAGESTEVVLTHRIDNRGSEAMELAPWALTAMAPGGRAVFPNARFVPFPEGLTPARPLVLWPYTWLGDPRWVWGRRYIQLKQDPSAEAPQKVGYYGREGWMAYELGRTLFVKRHAPQPGPHADFGCNVETFTNDGMLELETLGPLVRVAPGGHTEHVERWFLFEGIALGDDEASIARTLDPILAATEPPARAA